MNKLIFTILAVLLITASAFSQLVFQRIGGDTTYGATGSNYAYAYYKNTGTSPVEIRFKRTVNELPDTNWTSSICVGLCYAPFIDLVPLEGDPPFTLNPGEQDTMDITYTSPSLGVSRVVIRMYNEIDTTQYVDRNFYLNVNTVGINTISSIAENYNLGQNYPNPFNPVTNIKFSISNSENITLKVFDILGNEVETLVNNEKFSSGQYRVEFNGSNLSSGIYYYTIRAGNFSDTKKMILLK